MNETEIISDDDDKHEEKRANSSHQLISKKRKLKDLSLLSSTSTPLPKLKRKQLDLRSLLDLSDQQEEEIDDNNEQLQEAMQVSNDQIEEEIDQPSQEEVYENVPLEESVSELMTNENSKKDIALFLSDKLGPLAKTYMFEFFQDKDKSIDRSYGPYYKNDKLYLGNKPFDFDGKRNIIIGEQLFPITAGILEIIFKRQPNPMIYSKEDTITYKTIMLLTSLHKKNFNENEKNKHSKTLKYRQFILPLLNEDKQGAGLKKKQMKTKIDQNKKVIDSLSMQVNNKRPDYKYYNDVNELVARLELLFSSKIAGNNGLDNEILEIIDELMERGFIINTVPMNLEGSVDG